MASIFILENESADIRVDIVRISVNHDDRIFWPSR